jgi:hypothetical protein
MDAPAPAPERVEISMHPNFKRLEDVASVLAKRVHRVVS